MEVQTIILYGLPLFNLMRAKQLIQMPVSMPENEAGFVCILKGRCTNYTELEDFDLKTGQSVLAKSGDGIFKTHLLDGEPNFGAISIKFHKDVLERLYQNEPSYFFRNASISLTTNSVKIESNLLINQFIESILLYFDHPDSINEELLALKLKELIAILLKSEDAPQVIEIMSNLFEKKTFEFKEIIKSHIFSPISIPDLASLTSLSLSSFKKEFRRVFNDTPSHYIIGQRLNKAAELLENSDENISEIAYGCEFKSLAHMSRVFKDKFGVSPTEYRKSLVN